jgi:hypothetical protein
MNITEILCEDEDLFHVLQGKDKWREVFWTLWQYLHPVNTDICDQLIKYRVLQCSLHLLEQEVLKVVRHSKVFVNTHPLDVAYDVCVSRHGVNLTTSWLLSVVPRTVGWSRVAWGLGLFGVTRGNEHTEDDYQKFVEICPRFYVPRLNIMRQLIDKFGETGSVAGAGRSSTPRALAERKNTGRFWSHDAKPEQDCAQIVTARMRLIFTAQTALK